MTYEDKLDRVLDRMGGVYEWRDIESALKSGRMNSLAHKNSLLVFEVHNFPRARAMDWVLACGDLADCRVLHDRALIYAEDNHIDVIRAFGRRGWIPEAEARGWRAKTVNQVYVRTL